MVEVHTRINMATNVTNLTNIDHKGLLPDSEKLIPATILTLSTLLGLTVVAQYALKTEHSFARKVSSALAVVTCMVIIGLSASEL